MFKFFKSNKKSKDSSALAILDKKIFPYGREQKEAGAKQIIRLSNNKLDFMQSLEIYGKIKAQIYFLTDFENDEITQTIITNDLRSKNLTYIECFNIIGFILSDNEKYESQNNEIIDSMVNSAFNAKNEGYDLDMIPEGHGEFGLSLSNPIPVKGIISNEIYLKKLRTDTGEQISWKRQGSTRSLLIPNPIDVYHIFNQKGEFLTKLFISPYHKKISGIAPKGFIIYDEEKAGLKFFFPNFVKYFMSQKEYLQTEINIDTEETIEFSVPIITFGKIFGHIFYGITDNYENILLYLNVKSNKGYFIKGPVVQISEDLSDKEYNDVFGNIIKDVILNTEYLKITEGIL